MNARDRGVSTESRTGLDAEGPLRRWARRRREVAREEEEAAAEARRRKTLRESSGKAPHEAPDVRDSDAGASGPAASAAAEAEKVLTDEDMPSLDSLGEDSDYSGFLSPGVSEALRRRALRKLFTSAVFNVPDGLDDYDDDFTSFQALGDIVTSDMKHQAEMEAERAKQARADAEPASGDEDESGGAGDERPATAGDDAADLAEADPAAGTEPSEPRLSGEADSMKPIATAGDDAADLAEAGPAGGTEPSGPRLSGEAGSMTPIPTASDAAADLVEAGPVGGTESSGPRSSGEADSMKPIATAGDDAADLAEAGPAGGTEPSEPRSPGEAGSMGPTATGDAAGKEVRAKQARSDFEPSSRYDGEPIDAEREWRT